MDIVHIMVKKFRFLFCSCLCELAAFLVWIKFQILPSNSAHCAQSLSHEKKKKRKVYFTRNFLFSHLNFISDNLWALRVLIVGCGLYQEKSTMENNVIEVTGTNRCCPGSEGQFPERTPHRSNIKPARM